LESTPTEFSEPIQDESHGLVKMSGAKCTLPVAIDRIVKYDGIDEGGNNVVIFGYWHGTDHDIIREGIEAWRNHFPDFRIIGDSDIEPLIAKHFPKCLDLYRKIRIPCCKSDLARMLALHEWGGLYVDCHCGIRDVQFIRQLMASLDSFELIIFDKNRNSHKWHVTPSFMFARKNSDIPLECVTNAFRHLQRHWKVEKRHGFRSYNLWSMVASGNLADSIIDWSQPPVLKPRFAQKIWLFPEEAAPIARNMHRSHDKPGMHWSERQLREVLFN
jgi:hypothetical protein